MNKCLFTNEALTGETRVEHAIPETLGGRITSQTITSTLFNERAGAKLEPSLAGLYGSIMIALNPALPNSNRRGSVELTSRNTEGAWRIDEQLVPQLLRPVVTQRDSTGRPLSVIGPDSASLSKISKNVGGKVQSTREVIKGIEVLYPETALIHPNIEFALLKATLLSFDSVEKCRAITRSEALVSVRNLVRAYVMDDLVDVSDLAEYSLGRQYESEYSNRYRAFLRKARIMPQPFAHTLIISADPTSRSVDAVFCVFGKDPHAFRLCKNWSGGPLTFVLSNEILKNGNVIGPIQVHATDTLGIPNFRRSHMVIKNSFSKEDAETVRTEVSSMRIETLREAVYYVERYCPEYLIVQLQNSIRLATELTVWEVIVERLLKLFAVYTFPLEASLSAFANELRKMIENSDCAGHILACQASSLDWDLVIAEYRFCLESLVATRGLPNPMWIESNREEISIL